jgi:hypothetical protein
MNGVQAVLVDTINKLKCDKNKKYKNKVLQRIPYRVPPGGKHYCKIRNGKKNKYTGINGQDKKHSLQRSVVVMKTLAEDMYRPIYHLVYSIFKASFSPGFVQYIIPYLHLL